MRALAWLVCVILLLSAGCAEPVAESLTEAEAIRLSALLEDYGISATIERHQDQWRVLVADSSLTEARQLAVAHQLPETSPLPADDSSFSSISGAAHHDRIQRNLEIRLTESIERLNGVHDARVHLDLPRTDWGQVREAAPQASVILLHNEDVSTNRLKTEVHALLSGAVVGLEPQQITLILRTPQVPESSPVHSAQVGPWRVAPDSKQTLQWTLAAGLALLTFLSAAVAWLLLGRRREA